MRQYFCPALYIYGNVPESFPAHFPHLSDPLINGAVDSVLIRRASRCTSANCSPPEHVRDAFLESVIRAP